MRLLYFSFCINNDEINRSDKCDIGNISKLIVAYKILLSSNVCVVNDRDVYYLFLLAVSDYVIITGCVIC